jgi:Arc/MetJ-type ribon-helix-helix transcriptional regulator
MMENENLSIEIEKDERRETPTLTIRVTRELLNLIDRAVKSSEGRFLTRTDLIRSAAETLSHEVLEGSWKQTRAEEPEESTKDDLEHEANVEEALDLISGLEDSDIETVEELTSEAKEKELPKSVWSDDRVQKTMRKIVRDHVYPSGLWDGIRRYRRQKSREYVEVLRKGLAIPRSVAKQLVENPDFQGEQYEEWE